MIFWRKAKSIGVVFDRTTGAVRRVINPTFEKELDLHVVASDEVMRRYNKRHMGISDTMTLDDLYRVIEAASW